MPNRVAGRYWPSRWRFSPAAGFFWQPCSFTVNKTATEESSYGVLSIVSNLISNAKTMSDALWVENDSSVPLLLVVPFSKLSHQCFIVNKTAAEESSYDVLSILLILSHKSTISHLNWIGRRLQHGDIHTVKAWQATESPPTCVYENTWQVKVYKLHIVWVVDRLK